MLLVIDTALDHAQAALVEGGAVRGASWAASRGDAEAVVDHADRALREAGAGWGDVSAIAVTVGPGSFTGVRVGIAFAKGVAFARGLPATGVTTLDAIARQVGGPLLAAVDARHDMVFAALYDGGVAGAAGRMEVAHAVRLAREAGAGLAGPLSAIAALGGAGTVVERLDPLAIASAAAAQGSARPLSAVYFAAVDAAPQLHKALARA